MRLIGPQGTFAASSKVIHCAVLRARNNGVSSAVKLAEACSALGLKTSKIGAYASPRPKLYLGAFAAFAPREAEGH